MTENDKMLYNKFSSLHTNEGRFQLLTAIRNKLMVSWPWTVWHGFRDQTGSLSSDGQFTLTPKPLVPQYNIIKDFKNVNQENSKVMNRKKQSLGREKDKCKSDWREKTETDCREENRRENSRAKTVVSFLLMISHKGQYLKCFSLKMSNAQQLMI